MVDAAGPRDVASPSDVDDLSLRLSALVAGGSDQAALTSAVAEADPAVLARFLSRMVEQRLETTMDLQELQERAQLAQRLARLGDFEYDALTGAGSWSGNLFAMLGHRPGAVEPSRQRLLDHLHPDDRERVVEAHASTVRGEGPFQVEHRVVRRDGEVRHLTSRGEAVVDRDGAVRRVRGSAVDVTDRVMVQEAHEEGLVRLAEAQLRRRQATELHDDIVQGLTIALYALEMDAVEMARTNIQRTLDAAQRIISSLVEPLGNEDWDNADLVRRRASGDDG